MTRDEAAPARRAEPYYTRAMLVRNGKISADIPPPDAEAWKNRPRHRPDDLPRLLAEAAAELHRVLSTADHPGPLPAPDGILGFGPRAIEGVVRLLRPLGALPEERLEHAARHLTRRGTRRETVWLGLALLDGRVYGYDRSVLTRLASLEPVAPQAIRTLARSGPQALPHLLDLRESLTGPAERALTQALSQVLPDAPPEAPAQAPTRALAQPPARAQATLRDPLPDGGSSRHADPSGPSGPVPI
ncbi:hypothetical protein POF50_031705 [Streptomyces sp. SL13]|uniref:Uncharacterized protein n=1 Tax=Streptantibioticus silvisoli TaxID=2705255 RepID=A0AA90H9T8_9ACTN|nr:hypothetical protein [Streptantibioticus silvisoli]MDI5973855.1 hypothetical protein [Streptantibioticus silvisoli]